MTNIEAARNARGAKEEIIEHYQAAKDALIKVDAPMADPTALRETIAAYHDLAMVKLDRGQGSSPAAASSSMKPSWLKTIAHARDDSSASLSNNATFASIHTSTATAVSTTPSTRQPSPPTLRAAVSIATACVVQASPPFFTQDVNPAPYICQLPRPDEPLHTTRQLAYCLALLQASVHEDDLSPDELTWRHSTLDSSDAKGLLENMTVQVLEAFAAAAMKDAAAVAEIVQLAPVLNSDQSRFLLKTFIDTIHQSKLLQYHPLEGLAKAVQGAAPGSIDSIDLVSILRCLHDQLRLTHSESHQHHLLLAISRVLDAMADAQVGDIDRINLHGPLTHILRKSESGKSLYLNFQAAYATQ